MVFSIYLDSTSTASKNLIPNSSGLLAIYCVNLQQALVGNNFLAWFVVNKTVFSKLIPKSRNQSKFIRLKLIQSLSLSSSSFEGHPLHVRHKQNWGRGFILLLPQTAALPGSDAGSGVIKQASSFVIQNRQTSCSMWCPMYRARC